MTTLTILSLTLVIFIAAVLYSAVGQAGASGYLAVMALFGLPPEIIKPTALVLNIIVATIAAIKFYRAGYFSWRVFWPFAITSIPLAYLGGRLTLPGPLYKVIVGLVLLFAAYRLYLTTRITSIRPSQPPPVLPALAAGSGIGFLSGLTGVGGGIFLSPLLIFAGWAETRVAFGVSAAFILVNSLAGIAGQAPSPAELPAALPLWAFAAAVGGWLGSEFGSRRLDSQITRRLLVGIMVIAGLRMILGVLLS